MYNRDIREGGITTDNAGEGKHVQGQGGGEMTALDYEQSVESP